MELKHTSVLLQECINGLNIKTDGVYVDCTLGGAGHSKEICKKLSPKGTLVGIDQDDYALNRAEKTLDIYKCNKILVRDNFSNIKEILEKINIEKIDGVLMDLGVSSFQLDDDTRGFSYNNDGPLDMRMDNRRGFSAYDIVNGYDEKSLIRILKDYGEERFSKRIAKEIIRRREEKPIVTTAELVEIIKISIPARFRREGSHPAKRVFQAIRIEVNEELSILKDSIKDYICSLNRHGRICIISFHSLEDRIVKKTYRALANPCTCPPDFPQCICNKKASVEVITRKPILPSLEEVESNPRSRSAKLRIAKKV